MRSYEAARNLFSFLTFCAWSVVALGVIVALMSAENASRYGDLATFMAMIPGVGVGMAGLIMIAFVQMGRAGVDTAEYTQQMLKISRDQLEVSRQALSAKTEQPKAFSAAPKLENPVSGFKPGDFGMPDTSSADQYTPQIETVQKATNGLGFKRLNDVGNQLEYRGYIIEVVDGAFTHAGRSWANGTELKKHLDNITKTAPQ